jgi:methionyl-tRNA formyltransferase
VRIGFAGTPEFAVPTLAALCAWAQRHDAAVTDVWTQPDRPAGRGRRLTASPVKQAALDHGARIHQPRSLRDPAALAELRDARLDLLVVVAYGLILPLDVLRAPRLGCVNVHASLLPRWRGAAPIQRAIAAGDRVSGIGIMAMDEGLDTGALWRNVPVPILPEDTGGTLHDRLAAEGARQLVDALSDIFGGVAPTPQDPTMVTYASKLSKAEATVDWTQDAGRIADQVRAFVPWPVAQTTLDGRQLRLWSADAVAGTDAAQPGRVIDVSDGIVVACGSGALRLTRVQVAGGRPLDATVFVRAHECLERTLGESC